MVLSKEQKLDESFIPYHISIIPDGNRRWACSNGVSIDSAYQFGSKVLKTIIQYLLKIGVKVISCYVLSSDNLKKRDENQIKDIFYLIYDTLEENMNFFLEHKIRVCCIGSIKDIPYNDVVNKIMEVEKKTSMHTNFVLVMAINYVVKDDIKRSFTRYLSACKNNTESNDVCNYLDLNYLAKVHRSPDLLIRTGGDKRLSNFLLEVLSYTEFFFNDILWPDFTVKNMESILFNFYNRKRNYGA